MMREGEGERGGERERGGGEDRNHRWDEYWRGMFT